MWCRLARVIGAFLTAAAFVGSFGASAQVFQSGGINPNHVVMWTADNAVQDAGFAVGATVAGQGIGELLQVNPTSPPGSGPDGTHVCLYSAPLAVTYSYLCFDANALGGALIDVGGSAGNTGLNLKINSALYSFPGPGYGNIIGPLTTTINEPVVWNSTGGTLVKDGLNVTIVHTGALTVSGAVSLGSTLGVAGATTLSGTLAVTGATTLGSTLAVTQGALFSGAPLTSGTGFAVAFAGGKSIIGSVDYDTSSFLPLTIAGSYIAIDGGVLVNGLAATTGTGVGIAWTGSYGIMAAVDYDTSSFEPLQLAGSTVAVYGPLTAANNVGILGGALISGGPMTTGSGVGIAWTGAYGIVGAVDYDTASFEPLQIAGSTVTYFAGSGGSHIFDVNSTPMMTITGTGVGIGTSTPILPFQVASTMLVSGQVPTNPTTGSGLGLAFETGSNTSVIASVNYATSSFLPLSIGASSVIMGYLESAGTQCVEATSSGALIGAGSPCGLNGGMALDGSNASGAALTNIGAAATTTFATGVGAIFGGGPVTSGSGVGIAWSGTYGIVAAGNFDISTFAPLQLAGSTVTIEGPLYTRITGSIQCLQVASSGQVTGTGSPCGSGGSGGGMNTGGSNATGAALTNIGAAATTPFATSVGALFGGGPATAGTGVGIAWSGTYGIVGAVDYDTATYEPLQLAGSTVTAIGQFFVSTIAGSTQCVEALSTGQLTGTGSPCGSGGGGGMNTSGSNAGTGALANIGAAATAPMSTPVGMLIGGAAPTSGLGVGIAWSGSYGIVAAINYGTSAFQPLQLAGSTVTIEGPLYASGITGSTQCVQALSTGQLTGTGSPCGSGGGGGMNTGGTNATGSALAAIGALASSSMTTGVGMSLGGGLLVTGGPLGVGTGVGIAWTGSYGIIAAVNYGTSSFEPLQLAGSTVTLLGSIIFQLNSGTAAGYACFTSFGQLIYQTAAC